MERFETNPFKSIHFRTVYPDRLHMKD